MIPFRPTLSCQRKPMSSSSAVASLAPVRRFIWPSRVSRWCFWKRGTSAASNRAATGVGFGKPIVTHANSTLSARRCGSGGRWAPTASAIPASEKPVFSSAARRAREVDGYRAWVKAAAEHGIGAEVIEGDAVRAVMKDDLSPPPAGLWCPSDGRAEPQKAASAIALAARAKGAVILTDCAVRGP